RLRLEHLLGGAAGGGRALLQVGRDGGHRLAHADALGVGAGGAGGLLGRGQRLRHADDRARGDALPDPHPAQHAHASSSWSVVSTSTSSSSTVSAFSPSALSTTWSPKSIPRATTARMLAASTALPESFAMVTGMPASFAFCAKSFAGRA